MLPAESKPFSDSSLLLVSMASLQHPGGVGGRIPTSLDSKSHLGTNQHRGNPRGREAPLAGPSLDWRMLPSSSSLPELRPPRPSPPRGLHGNAPPRLPLSLARQPLSPLPPPGAAWGEGVGQGAGTGCRRRGNRRRDSRC